MKISIIVVTYNRINCLKLNVRNLIQQTNSFSELIIVDNASTDETETYCCKLMKEYSFIKYYRLNENKGGAGGFSYGMKKAIERGADYIWAMDDDAIPHCNALEEIIKFEKQYSGDKYCLISNIYYMDNMFDDGLKKLAYVQYNEEERETCKFTFLGFFISKNIIEEIGYPREDLFIYYDDLDYYLRMIEHGYKVVAVFNSIIEHPNSIPIERKRLLGCNVNVQVMPRWKRYYYIRNYLLIMRKKGRNYRAAIIKNIKVLIKILIFYPTELPISIRGFIDGILNKAGKGD